MKEEEIRDRSIKLPISPFKKILKERGAMFVSRAALIDFIESVQEIAEDIADYAIELAFHAKRKTIMKNDIKMAVKTVRR